MELRIRILDPKEKSKANAGFELLRCWWRIRGSWEPVVRFIHVVGGGEVVWAGLLKSVDVDVHEGEIGLGDAVPAWLSRELRWWNWSCIGVAVESMEVLLRYCGVRPGYSSAPWHEWWTVWIFAESRDKDGKRGRKRGERVYCGLTIYECLGGSHHTSEKTSI